MNALRRLTERPQALFLLLAVLCAGGVWTATRLPSAIFPTVTFPRVKVIAEGAEEPAAQMIPAVTRPLEESILRVPGIEKVVSTTARGSVEIGANFTWGTDMRLALQRVQAEIDRARPTLPPDLRIDAEWMNTAIFPILGYSLTSDSLSQAALRELADYQLRPALIQIPGVSQVQVQGGALREFQVRLDPERLTARRLAVSEVVDAIRKNNVLASAGLVEANHELYLSIVTGKPAGIEELGRISIAPSKGGVPARLADIADIRAADAMSFIRT
ncbi:MAG TPA: efflux RND transporter permease subunit, partial [Thermoanaerobaculia bacterium]|nr:efflux RND transporter permease subunit [Thermoanaerobaculia bacterium]